jgi:hypothetical protein
VSVMFSVNGTSLWFPGNKSGRLFKAQAEAVAASYGIPSGIGELYADEYVIDLPVLEKFVQTLARQYDHHGILYINSLIEGVLGISYVLVERAGGHPAEITPQQAPGWDDLRIQFSREMPA